MRYIDITGREGMLGKSFILKVDGGKDPWFPVPVFVKKLNFLPSFVSTNCSRLKRKCFWRIDAPKCDRCQAMNRECVAKPTKVLGIALDSWNEASRTHYGFTEEFARNLQREFAKPRPKATRGTLVPVDSRASVSSGSGSFTATSASLPATPSSLSTPSPDTLNYSSDGSTVAFMSPTILLPSDMPFPHMANRCLESYWNSIQNYYPMVHRPSFEDAFRSHWSPIYAQHKPAALLYAMLAYGAFALYLDEDSITASFQMRMIQAYGTRCRDLLLAGQRVDGGNNMTALEVGQAVGILSTLLLPLGKIASGITICYWATDIMQSLVFNPAYGCPMDPDTRPLDVNDWIRREIAMRCWTTLALVDAEWDYLGRRKPVYNFYPLPRMTMPCHDTYFYNRNPLQAFETLFGPTYEPPVINVKTFLDNPTRERGRILAMEFIQPVFEGRASICAMLMLHMFARILRNRARGYAEAKGIETLKTLAKPVQEWTRAEHYYMDRVEVIENMIAGMYQAMPDKIGRPLASGDAVPFFDNWPQYFESAGLANGFFIYVIYFRSFTIESLVHGDGVPTDMTSLFHSKGFLRVLETAIVFVAMMRDQMNHKEGRDWLTWTPGVAALRISALFMAASKMLVVDGPCDGNSGGGDPFIAQRTAFEDNIRVIAAYLDAIAPLYGPLIRAAALNFRLSVIAAGISLKPPRVTELGYDDMPTQIGTMPAQESGEGVNLGWAVMAQDRLVQPWWNQKEKGLWA